MGILIKIVFAIILIANYGEGKNPPKLSTSFSAVVRPGAIFFPQFVNLTSHIYSWVNYSSNGTALAAYISEKDYVNPGDTEPRYQVYMNSVTNYAYYVDGKDCQKTSLSDVSIFCFYIPSYITALVVDEYPEDTYTYNKTYEQCPHHPEAPCDKWYDSDEDVTIYTNGDTIEVILMSGLLYKPMIYDNFQTVGPIPSNFLPEMECKETDNFPLCQSVSNTDFKLEMKSKILNSLFNLSNRVVQIVPNIW